MPYNIFSHLTIHLTASAIPRPLSLGGLVEATFPGYQPAPVTAAQAVRVNTGLTSLKCTALFRNEGIAGSAVPTGAFLVDGAGESAKLVAFLLLKPGSYPTIGYGNFQLEINFVFNSQE